MSSPRRWLVPAACLVLGLGLSAWNAPELGAHPGTAAAVLALGFGTAWALFRPAPPALGALGEPQPEVVEAVSSPSSLNGEKENTSEFGGGSDSGLSRLADEARFYRVCLKHLGDSTTENLLTMTTPFSAEILGVQQSIAGFVRKVRDHDEEITSESATRWIEEKRQGVGADMELVAKAVQDGFRSFETNMVSLETIMKNVLQTTAKIEDVAQRINVLSINAAIEAARAGVSGRGFKVISDHIRTIAHETSQVIEGIHATLTQTVGTFQGIDEGLRRKRAVIQETLTAQHENFATFYQVFDEHNRRFVDLYHDTMGFVNQLAQTMKSVSPLVQLHEITVQEMQNQSLVQEDFFQEIEGAADPGPVQSGAADWGPLVDRIRRRLTTARELDALEAALRKTGAATLDLHRSGQAIEFF